MARAAHAEFRLCRHAGTAKTEPRVLRDQVLGAMRRGDERGAIHQANLIPPGLLSDQPDVYQPYSIMREQRH